MNTAIQYALILQSISVRLKFWCKLPENLANEAKTRGINVYGSNVHTMVLLVDNFVAMHRKKAVKLKTFLLYTKTLLLSHSLIKITFKQLASVFKEHSALVSEMSWLRIRNAA
jgi:hypothetical protein